MRKILTLRPPAGNFDVFEADDVELVYADGVGMVQLSQYNCKLDLFVNEPVETDQLEMKLGGTPAVANAGRPERRVVHHRVVIPLPQLIEMSVKVVSLISSDEENMKKAFGAQTEQFFENVRKLSAGIKP